MSEEGPQQSIVVPKDGEFAHPRPWARTQYDKHDFSLLAFGGEVAHIESEEADFDFIYEAVNVYDAALDLVRECERIGYLGGAVPWDVGAALSRFREAQQRFRR